MNPLNKIIQSIISNMVCIDSGNLYIPTLDPEISYAQINIPLYYINKYPITKKEWYSVMNNTVSTEEEYPMVNVSWYDALEFIKKLNRLTRGNFRLPTKVEWEYAASGGKMAHGFTYSGGDQPGAVAHYKTETQGSIHIVGQKSPNELGLYDMSGNVWEWCADYCPYHNNPHNQKIDVLNNFKDSHRIIKGGSGGTSAYFSQIKTTYGRHPDTRSAYLGFRLAF